MTARLSAALVWVLLAFGASVRGQVSVLTWHNDNARTGQNFQEHVLTPAKVNGKHFGKLFSVTVDGQVYTQPLYLAKIKIPGQGRRNVVYVATEHDSVYAFDADQPGPPLWHASFIDAAKGITPVPQKDVGTDDITVEIGITGTPVIDAKSGTLYVVAKTLESGRYMQRLHALDVATGKEKFGGPVLVEATARGNGYGDVIPGRITWDPKIEHQRCALLLHDGIVYVSWASHGDNGLYHGWIIGYDAHTLQPIVSYVATPDGTWGGIWQSGAAPSVDRDGSIFISVGNGSFDGDTVGRDYGDSVLRLVRKAGNLSVADFFTPFDQQRMSDVDDDLGSTGVLLVPAERGRRRRLLIVADKEGTIYVIDRQHMGGYRPRDNNQVVQVLRKVGSGVYSTPAYWNGRVYIASSADALKEFTISDQGLSPRPHSQSRIVMAFPGATPSISANRGKNGIVWIVETDGYGSRGPAVLRAYDATDLGHELYNSQQNPRDRLAIAVKFAVPTIANGKVYVGASGQLAVFGLTL